MTNNPGHGSLTLFGRLSTLYPSLCKHSVAVLSSGTPLLLTLMVVSPWAYAAPADVPTQQLHQINADISRMQNHLQITKGKQTETQRALQQAEERLAKTHAQLDQLNTQHAAINSTIGKLGSQLEKLKASSDAQKKALAAQLNALYRLGTSPKLKLLLEQRDPTELERYQRYLNAIESARRERIEAIARIDEQISTNRDQTAQQKSRLERLIAKQKDNEKQLIAQQRDRQKTLKSINDSYTNSQSRLDDLNAQRQQAQQTLARIEREVATARRAAEVKAAQQRADAERRRQEASQQNPLPPEPQEPQQQRPSTPPSSGSQLTEQEMSAEPTSPSTQGTPDLGGTSQRQLAGGAWSGRWPINGTVVSGFGAGEGISSNGIVLRAREGTPIHALRAGEVVFSNWLNGFGYIVIVDHGSVMSVYAHNQRNLVQVGDSVKRGTVLATVGDTGGLDTPQLYFELRQGGRPINPNSWAAASR